MAVAIISAILKSPFFGIASTYCNNIWYHEAEADAKRNWFFGVEFSNIQHG